MLPMRKKPSSIRQKRSVQKYNRAIKRGEEPEEPPLPRTNKYPIAPQRSIPVGDGYIDLKSRFISLPPDYAENTRNLAFSTPLQRPLPASSAIFPVEIVDRPEGRRLVVPTRPPFTHGMTKHEVERNEEAEYYKWLVETRSIVDDWFHGGSDAWPRSPSSFETNLEVWRQLWRVVESSSIILLLVDSRCPPVHVPRSLRNYLRAVTPRKQVVLVLTKADLVDPAALAGWREWLQTWWSDGTDDDVQVVSVTSLDTGLLYGEKPRQRPAIPSSSRAELVAALRRAHERLEGTVPDVDWDHLGDSSSTAEEAERLTIGLVGQPNVGKSSLLNALVGTHVVAASRTPGKTKHFQTILWGQVKIVDCPGLVCPSLVPMELQAMAGILPIAQIPSLSSCIHFASTHMPLEVVFRVPPPEVEVDLMAAKRTWRGPRPVEDPKPAQPMWTAGVIMEQRAIDRGFFTAQSGRPDANRAGNQMLRTLADGRVRWGFWPPGADVSTCADVGVWLGCGPHIDIDAERGIRSDNSSDETPRKQPHATIAEEDEESDEDEFVRQNNCSFFAALTVGDRDSDDDSE